MRQPHIERIEDSMSLFGSGPCSSVALDDSDIGDRFSHKIPWARTTKLNHSWIPAPQKVCEIINVLAANTGNDLLYCER